MVPLCPRDSPAGVLVVLGVILLLFAAIVAAATHKRNPRAGALTFGGLAALLALISAGVLHRSGKRFDSYSVAGSSLTLGYPWPKGDVTVPLASVSHVTVEREQYVTHGKTGAGVHEQGRVLLDGASDAYQSCESTEYPQLAQGGKALAAALHAPPEWAVKCDDGRDLKTTEATVSNPRALGDATFTTLCGSAKSSADFR